MRLTRRQKRLILKLAQPGLRLLFWGYRLLGGELFRDHSLPRPQEPVPASISRILVVRLDTIGDVLLSEPAIAALRQRFPNARLDAVVAPVGKAVLAGSPDIDNFFIYDAPWHAAWRGRPVKWRDEWGKLGPALGELRRQRYDLALELRGDFRDILFTAAVGARITVGSGWRGGGFMLDHDVNINQKRHQLESTLAIVAATGAPATPRSPRLYVQPEHRRRAQEALAAADNQTLVAIHLGAGFPSKRLPLSSFLKTAHALVPNGTRRLVLIGGEEDRPLADKFLTAGPTDTINLVGSLGLLETAAVLERCQLFLGNDSGPMHMAAAVGTPVVCFFGPSEPYRYRPYGVEHRVLEVELDCRPCDFVHCVHREYLCMNRIAVADIVAAAEELLSKKDAMITSSPAAIQQ